MDQTLGYLREILSNYNHEHSYGRHIYRKLLEGHFTTEESFVRHLDSKEIDFLNDILPKEINHAKEVRDEKRAQELNEVYELLF